jgi:hypothetical protein
MVVVVCDEQDAEKREWGGGAGDGLVGSRRGGAFGLGGWADAGGGAWDESEFGGGAVFAGVVERAGTGTGIERKWRMTDVIPFVDGRVAEGEPMFSVLPDGKWELDTAAVRKCKLYIGAPAFGGMVSGFWKSSMDVLRFHLQGMKFDYAEDAVYNESLVTRARNQIAAGFLATDYTHLLFVDVDEKFEAEDVFKMVAMNLGVVCGFVPMKGYDWGKMFDYASGQAWVGKSREEALREFRAAGLSYAVHRVQGREPERRTGAVEVSRGGTGAMLIQRRVFETILAEERVDKIDNCMIPRLKPWYYNFFGDEVSDGEHRSEDYFFCERWKECGGKVWAYEDGKFGHFGGHLFEGMGVKL